jgi:hypothetical protein
MAMPETNQVMKISVVILLSPLRIRHAASAGRSVVHTEQI